MERPSRWSAAVVVALVQLVACKPSNDGGSMTAQRMISDQVHNAGVPGFFWMPPLAPTTTYGEFRAGLKPVVVIHEIPVAEHQPLTTFTVDRGEVRDDGTSHYLALWDTKATALDVTATYRIRVLLEGFELGFADVDVVASGSELRNVSAGEYIPLLDGRTLPIKFRIEPDALRCVGVVCEAIDQCHDAGACDPLTGICSDPQKLDGAPCDDQNACTRSDTCNTGECIGADPVVCVAADQCHDAGTCDTATGECTNPPKYDGAACNDGSACTRSDACESGVCTGSDPVRCFASDACHFDGVCDPMSGACTDPLIDCEDGDACTLDACELPTAQLSGGCRHVRSSSGSCAETCLVDPSTGTTTCTPASYEDVTILSARLDGAPLHANQDVRIAITLEAVEEHDAYPVQAILVPIDGLDWEGHVLATTAIRNAATGSAEYWIDGHIPTAVDPGEYLLLVRRYPDGELVGPRDPAIAYDVSIPDPQLPVLDLVSYFADQRALLADADGTVDPEAPTTYRDSPFSGTIEIVARNHAVVAVPITAYLRRNDADLPLQFWDAAQGRYADSIVIGGPGKELQPNRPRAQYVELALAEPQAALLRSELASGPVAAEVVFVLNAGGSVEEASCIPFVTGPPICRHSLAVDAILGLAPSPAPFAPESKMQGLTAATKFVGATWPVRLGPPRYSTFPENDAIGAGVVFDAWTQLSQAGLDSYALVDFPIKMMGARMSLQKVEINASAGVATLPHFDYLLHQAGGIVFADSARYAVDASTIDQTLPFPELSAPEWSYSQTYWIEFVPVTLEASVALDVGLGANHVYASEGVLAVKAQPWASASGSLAAYVGLADIGAGAEGTVSLVEATLSVDHSGSFTVHDEPTFPGRRYLLADLAHVQTRDIGHLDGSIDLFIEYPMIDVCTGAWGIPYPCIHRVKETLPICSFTGFHKSASYAESTTDYRLDLLFAYPEGYCSTPLGGAQRCGTLPPDDYGNALQCADCPVGYECNIAENVCRAAAGSVVRYPIPTPQSLPTGIAAGGDGNVWFTEYGTDRIGRIAADTGVITEFLLVSGSAPAGIAAAPDGTLWFVEGNAGSARGADILGRISVATGQVTEFTFVCKPPSTTWCMPDDVAVRVGANGFDVWFTELLGMRVGRFDPATGTFDHYPIAQASPYTCLYYPRQIESGPDGNMWVTLPQSGSSGTTCTDHRVARVTPAGVITTFPVPAEPGGIAAGPDGNIWFTEPKASRIGRISLQAGSIGQVTDFEAPGGAARIAAGPDGNLWFTQANAGSVGRITPEGAVTIFATPGQDSWGVTAGSDGNVWFTDRLGNAIGRLVP